MEKSTWSTFLRIACIRLRGLNPAQQFDWPLPDRSPDSNCDRATHSAETVVAHYQIAVKNEKISHVFDRGGLQELGNEYCSSGLRVDGNRSMQILFRDISFFAASETPELERRMNSVFYAEDIRSLEMKFAAIIVSWPIRLLRCAHGRTLLRCWDRW